ncbi:DUF1674 domain-containing protein [Falsiroseomonas sp. CW058]|uniref:DUF1674 domain-containing protein n=1 Tax=Falsiroseomonas sp. CW058 TaxID=3388664 RepID=UPI003D30F61C
MTDANNPGGSALPGGLLAQQLPIPPANPPGAPPGIPVPEPDPAPIQPPPDNDMPLPGDPPPPPVGDPPAEAPMRLKELGGPAGPEPTRYGDWERKGRVSDF